MSVQRMNVFIMLLELSLVILAALLVWIIISYKRWKRNLLKTLNENSEVATTSRGEIEYILKMWNDAGFSLLSISRPGYLRTPLSTGETFEEQADAIAALLDTLGISKVVILAASGGGPIGLYFALRHPNRLNALILMAAVSNEYTVDQEALDSTLARLFLSDSIADFGAWLYDVITRRWTSMALKEAFKETVNL
ncbi:MAG: alpha/beta fold hydrolase, partial [Candidatus Thorarchaeota archaeon]